MVVDISVVPTFVITGDIRPRTTADAVYIVLSWLLDCQRTGEMFSTLAVMLKAYATKLK